MRKKSDVRRLKRAELLEMLIEQAKTAEKLERELEKLKRQSDSRTINLGMSGSVTEAMQALSYIIENSEPVSCINLNLKIIKAAAGEDMKDCKEEKKP